MIDRHTISLSATLFDALEKLNNLSGGSMTLFAIDDKGRLRGSLTDGDIRRSLLKGATLDTNVDKSMHENCQCIETKADYVAKIRELRSLGIKLIPRVDTEGRILEIIDLAETTNLLPVTAILMAGGKGERLRPLTLDTPKPLLKVGDKAIIDHNVEALLKCGVKEIYVMVNYLAEKIENHFSQKYNGAVKCIKEDMPLGTIGAAAMVPLQKEGVSLVMNSDLLTTISLEDMYLHHIGKEADITIATIPYQISVPYAIMDMDNEGWVKRILEKPSYSYLANAGIYMINNKWLMDLPKNQRTDATDLIEEAITKKAKVTSFPINGYWLDIGNPADFRQATELMKNLNGFNK